MRKLSIFFVIMILLSGINFISAKGAKNKEQSNLLGKNITKSYSLGEVTQINISSFSEVVLEYGTENSYTIIADSIIHEHILMNQQGNQLSIKTAPKGKTMEKNIKGVKNLESTQRIVIRTNQLALLQLNAVSNFHSNAAYHSDEFKLEANAVSKIALNVDCKQFGLDVNACSSVKIIGKSDKTTINSNAVSHLSIKELESIKVNIEANACSFIDLYAKEEMQITASSISKMIYNGNFKISKENLKSIGSLTRN